jgi:hypothetical protein
MKVSGLSHIIKSVWRQMTDQLHQVTPENINLNLFVVVL